MSDTPLVFYNEFDTSAAQWLRNLMAAGELPAGTVDKRSIADVQGSDLAGYRQVHLFAGIGGWPLALRLAGWPDDVPVWTGSCPCQPYSVAGKRQGEQDPRDLWPQMFRLIRECRPPTVFGEQVEAAIGHSWLDRVFADLEREGYACGTAVLPAACVGAPHQRHRIFWVADAGSARGRQDARGAPGDKTADGCAGWVGGESNGDHVPCGSGTDVRLAESAESRCNDTRQHGSRPSPLSARSEQCGSNGGVGNMLGAGSSQREVEQDRCGTTRQQGAVPLVASSAWERSRTIECRDGKCRRISAESGDGPLARGIPRRVGPGFAGLDRVGIRAARTNRVIRLRGYGNAIVPELAAEFVWEYMEVRP